MNTVLKVKDTSFEEFNNIDLKDRTFEEVNNKRTNTLEVANDINGTLPTLANQLTTLSNEIIDAEFTVEQSKELVVANDNTFPTLPPTPEALPAYIVVANKALEAETKLLKGLVMNPKKYSQALKSTQEHAALLLEAQLRLADALKSIKTQRGLRND